MSKLGKTRYTIFLSVALCSTFGCTVKMADEGDEDSVGKIGDIGTSRSALTIQTFTWNQNLGHSTVMMNSNTGYCVLTGIAGKFEGLGEGVWIDRSNGFWVLAGQSQQVDVSARATCISW